MDAAMFTPVWIKGAYIFYCGCHFILTRAGHINITRYCLSRLRECLIKLIAAEVQKRVVISGQMVFPGIPVILISNRPVFIAHYVLFIPG